MELSQVIGLASVAVALAGFLEKRLADTRRRCDLSEQELHRRISDLRAEVGEEFVRKETVDARLAHLEETLREIRNDLRMLVGRRALHGE